MKSARVEHAPDYKSRVNAELRKGKSVPEAMELAHPDAERSRLESELMEAAKKWLAEKIRLSSATFESVTKVELYIEADKLLEPHIKALTEFESKREGNRGKA